MSCKYFVYILVLLVYVWEFIMGGIIKDIELVEWGGGIC